MKYLTVLCLLLLMACNSEVSDSNPEKVDTQIAFEKGKWNKEIDGTYPYRHQMLDDILYQDTIRKLTRQEVLNLLGEPERVNGDHLYYLISQNKIGLWPIQTKTLVIKFADEERVEWIKLHG